MMRLLFLCLLLAAVTAYSDEDEGSAGEGFDDEDAVFDYTDRPTVNEGKTFTDNEAVARKIPVIERDPGFVSKTTNEADGKDRFTLIVVIVAVSLVALSVAVITAIFLVRRQMHNRPQGIYSVPTEQGQKGAV